MDFPSPSIPADSRAKVFLRYLDYFRSRVIAKLRDLPPEELRNSRLPSGWSPLELVKHLRYMERRWLEWGFMGQPVPEPWGDQIDDRWVLKDSDTRDSLIADLTAQAARSREIISAHGLDQVGQPGERWDGADPANLERVLFHVLQEYARHLGHLDVVVELATGKAGE
ncbi:MAG TPA: DinB family protein [Streptosporangiaceae bacterium]|nr:DinB family protein [Streptosporangiaceae bacterium]